MMRNNDFEALVQAKHALRTRMIIAPDENALAQVAMGGSARAGGLGFSMGGSPRPLAARPTTRSHTRNDALGSAGPRFPGP